MTTDRLPMNFVSLLEAAPGGDRSIAKAAHLPSRWPDLKMEASRIDYDRHRKAASRLRSKARRDAFAGLLRSLSHAWRVLIRLAETAGVRREPAL